MRAIDRRLVFMAVTVPLVGIFGAINAALLPIDEGGPPSTYAPDVKAIVEASRRETGSKILLAGGSNVVFGLRADVISTLTGAPVVNAGIPSTMSSMTSYANVLAATVDPGDIVIVSPSELLYPAELSGLGVSPGRAKALTALTGIPFTASDWRMRKFWLLIPKERLATRLILARAAPRDVPSRSFGNQQVCQEAPGPRVPLNLPSRPPSRETLGAVRSLAETVRSRGGEIYFVLPWILVKEQEVGQWQTYSAKLINRLEDIAPVIGPRSGENLFIQGELFCDTPTHLLEPARSLRSREVGQHVLRLGRSWPGATARAARQLAHDL